MTADGAKRPFSQITPAAGQLRVVVPTASPSEISGEMLSRSIGGGGSGRVLRRSSRDDQDVCLRCRFRGAILLSPLRLLHSLCTGRSVVKLPVVGIRVNSRKRRKHLRRSGICVSSKMGQNALPVAPKILLVPFVYR